jgi:hypothetical protein
LDQPPSLSDDVLLSLSDTLRVAEHGCAKLDAWIECFIAGKILVSADQDGRYWWRWPDRETVNGPSLPARAWSQDSRPWGELIPADHDYALGRRDGVPWAWVQPNDGWQPGEHDMRHDHPAGSGLVVARHALFPIITAIVILIGKKTGRDR